MKHFKAVSGAILDENTVLEYIHERFWSVLNMGVSKKTLYHCNFVKILCYNFVTLMLGVCRRCLSSLIFQLEEIVISEST